MVNRQTTINTYTGEVNVDDTAERIMFVKQICTAKSIGTGWRRKRGGKKATRGCTLPGDVNFCSYMESMVKSNQLLRKRQGPVPVPILQ
ncbi:hypothetical protein CRG98_043940, partial [Punica granatum]